MKKLTRILVPYIVIASVIITVFCFSFVFFVSKNQAKIRTFIIPSADSGIYIVEKRKLSKEPVQGDIQLYIDEILLGSCVERTKKLFSNGTKVEFCFVRDDILYLNLSDNLLKAEDYALPINQGIELLGQNIKKNFKKIQNIQLFVGGNYAYSL